MCSTPPNPTRDDRMLLNKFSKLLIKAVGMRTLSLERKYFFGLFVRYGDWFSADSTEYLGPPRTTEFT